MGDTDLQTYSGFLSKMKGTLNTPIDYRLPLGSLEVHLNPLLGREILLEFTGRMECVSCGRAIKKSYQQGHCFPCTQTLASCDLCILKPELCHFDRGTCREPEWGKAHCMKDHFVYMANSSGLKVGITRAVNIPTRWIDQGAVQALAVFKVSTRFQSGRMEVLFKQHMADKTNWRTMLKGDTDPVDLLRKRAEITDLCREELGRLSRESGLNQIHPLPDEKPLELSYPVLEYPTRIKSYNFDKTPKIQGRLMGIKGQYLMLADGVLNIRKFSGYEVIFGIK